MWAEATERVVKTREFQQSSRQGTARRWSLAHYLALVAVPLIVWEAWTIVAWLVDGPRQVTQFRDKSSSSWYVAHGVEAILLLLSAVLVVYVVRGVIRARKVTFDALFVLCAVTMVWGDMGTGVFQPVLLNSSNFINVNSTCGHMPFVVNPDCGRLPDNIVFNVGVYICLLGLAICAQHMIQRVRLRWPSLSPRRLILLIGATAGFLDLLIEPMTAIPLRLWTYGPSAWSISLGGGAHYPLVSIVAGIWFLGLPIALYVFKDDRGHTVLERGLERHSPRYRTLISGLALYTFFQVVIWGAALPLWPNGLFANKWRAMPAHIVNAVCDAPGFNNTRYGTCPGDLGYRMPGRHSLPGQSP